LPVTNTVAQFAPSTVTKEKGFIPLTPELLWRPRLFLGRSDQPCFEWGLPKATYGYSHPGDPASVNWCTEKS